MLYLTAILLTLWFWRKNASEAVLWMLATYASVAVLAWGDYFTAATLEEAIPKIVRDFIVIGVVGLVQSLAVARRIPVWLAILLTLGLFTFLHLWEGKEIPARTAPSAVSATEVDPEGEWLVELAEGVAVEDFTRRAAAKGWSVTPVFHPDDASSTVLDNYLQLDVVDVTTSAQQLAEMEEIVWFEPNEVLTLHLPETTSRPVSRNPPLSINDPDTDLQWVMEVMQMEAYYQLLRQQQPVKRAHIAILDTGVDGRHEDLRENYRSIEKKYDNDPVGHGTHCAGIAASVTHNGIGIGSLAGAGSRNFVEVSGIKVLNAAGMGTQKSIIAGIIEATDEGADVISLSLGGVSNQSRQRAYNQAVKYALDHNAIVVAAAGNSAQNAKRYAPANARGIITVAAVDPDLQQATFTNTVQDIQWGIAAPGVGIYSTTPDNNYKIYSGTSMACPFVAGLLGTMRALDPELSAASAYRILRETGYKGEQVRRTGRIVQPAAALQETLAAAAGK